MPELRHVSVRTIQHRLKNDCNLPSRRAAKKPLLTEAMTEKRFQFAIDHRNWTKEDWATVMFTDESAFKTIRPGGTNMVSFWIDLFLID